MLLCPTLRPVQRKFVTFDVHNLEHLKAFEMLCIGVDTPAGFQMRQHPTLRFELEDGFLDVRSMMFSKIGKAWLTHADQIIERAEVQVA